MVDLAQPISEWKDIESNKEDDQYLGDICFSLRYVPTSGKVKHLQNWTTTIIVMEKHPRHITIKKNTISPNVSTTKI